MGGVITKIENWWSGLSSLRQTLIGIALGWVGTAALDYLWGRFGSAVSWWPVVTGMGYLREYVLNGYVASALASGLIVGFWPFIVSGFKATAPILRALLPLVALAIGIFVIPEVTDWWGARNDPRLFQLAPRVISNLQKMKAPLLTIEPSDLVKIYQRNTSLSASQTVKPYIGEMIAISGRIYDVETPDDNVNLQVHLSGHNVIAILNFAYKNRGPIWRLQKNQRIKALCELVAVDEASVGLTGCVLVP